MDLSKSQTGGVVLPRWAYEEAVALRVNELTERDRARARLVQVHQGFKETAYRYVFAYKDQYKAKRPFVTVLPSGKSGQTESLEYNAEAGLITFSFRQSIAPHLAKQQTDATSFVWERKDGTFALVQTWPCEINHTFKASFEEVDLERNPDPDHFNPEAFDDFKTAMLKLFELDATTQNLPWKAVKRKTENKHRLFIGKGEDLMSMFRIFKDIRDELDIKSLIEPDGIESKWTCKETGNSGVLYFRMDLKKQYCVYIKEGYDTLACVKTKLQFDMDCETCSGTALRVDETQEDLTCAMDLDWFATNAYELTRRSAVLVWTCAIVLVFFRVCGTALGWDWVNYSIWVLIVPTIIAGAYAVYADFSAMKWCIVPWLQTVNNLKMLGRPVPFTFFIIVSLFSTFLQTFTIQGNAAFMVSAALKNDEILNTWVFLWSKSMYKFLPQSTWQLVITPRSLAITLWILSTGQLLVPLLKGVPWSSPRRYSHYALLSSAEEEAQQHHHEFMTVWGKTVHECFEVFGCPPHMSTYRESVAVLSLASGLRYVGSTSLSYPAQRIQEIIQFKQGFCLQADKVLDLEWASQGWEMRSLQEFQKLAKPHLLRVVFIMFFKLALQMNLQITFMIIGHVQEDDENTKPFHGLSVGDIMSIMSLMFIFGTELIDVYEVLRIHCRVRGAVKKVVFEQVHSHGTAPYAYHDFRDQHGVIQRITYSKNDLKNKYYEVMRTCGKMVFLTFFCMWLIGYAFLKFGMALYCERGAWAVVAGCLDPKGQNPTL